LNINASHAQLKSFVWQEESLIIAILDISVLKVLIHLHRAEKQLIHAQWATIVVPVFLLAYYVQLVCTLLKKERFKLINVDIANRDSSANMGHYQQPSVHQAIIALLVSSSQ
jgi:hypothetical protein